MNEVNSRFIPIKKKNIRNVDNFGDNILIIDIDRESTFHDSRSLESTYGNDLD